MTPVKPAVAGVIGWPVAHSKSPLIHRYWLEKLCIDGDYSRFPVHPDKVLDAVRALPSLGIRGVNVTVPHKQAVMAAMDRIAPSAQAVGAVNTIVVEADSSLCGHNTDVDGITAALSDRELAGASVCLIGAGGAARAAMHVLHAAGVVDVAILARNASRAEDLLGQFGMAGRAFGFAESQAALSGRMAVINASPMGMSGQPEMPAAILDALPYSATQALAFDMVYAPLDTLFLCTARQQGFAIADGLVMLIGQAATAFSLFYGQTPPRDGDAELRAMLTA